MTKEDFVYSRIGMALISAQRVELIAGQLLEYLVEFDKGLYGLTTAEFLSKASDKGFKTLGRIFYLLKLNPKWVIDEELNAYLAKRNKFVHEFYLLFLTTKSDAKAKEAIEFCYDFGKHSDIITSFFKGFLYFLALRHVENCDYLTPEIKLLRPDFENFLTLLKGRNLSQD